MVFLSSSEFVGNRRVWKQSGTCSLQELINGLGVLENPTCTKLACWLAREVEAGGGGARVYLLSLHGMEGLESDVPHWVGCHSPLGPLYVFETCVSEFL